jgi:hypothetical protein
MSSPVDKSVKKVKITFSNLPKHIVYFIKNGETVNQMIKRKNKEKTKALNFVDIKMFLHRLQNEKEKSHGLASRRDQLLKLQHDKIDSDIPLTTDPNIKKSLEILPEIESEAIVNMDEILKIIDYYYHHPQEAELEEEILNVSPTYTDKDILYTYNNIYDKIVKD